MALSRLFLDARSLAPHNDTDTTGAVSEAARLAERAASRSAAERLAAVAPDALTLRLTELRDVLEAFDWPDVDAPWRSARLVVGGAAASGSDATDFDATAAVTGTLRYGDDAVQTTRFVSRAFDALAAPDLDPGDYSMTFSYAGRSESVSVSVTAEDQTWAEVLEKFADAVNAMALPVQADIVFQSVPGERVDGLLRTGTMLVLSQDAADADAHRDAPLRIDRSQFLPRALDLNTFSAAASQTPSTAAYSLTPLRRAMPTSFATPIVDPGAPAPLTDGTHYFAFSNGPASGTVAVNVAQGDTWREVLQKVANALNGAQSDFRAEVVRAERTDYVSLPDGDVRRVQAEGVHLALQAVAPKRGETVSFSFGRAEDAADAFHDPTPGLPTAATGATYIATATANGWTAGNVYTKDPLAPTTWVETTPTAGDVRWVDAAGDNYRFDGAAWSAAEDFVAAVGLDATAWPGQDGELVANGKTLTSTSNRYALDDGHLLADVHESSAETVPLKVVEALDRVERAVLGVVEGYNGLVGFLDKERNLWSEEFRAQWPAAVAANRTDLAWLGLRATNSGRLWADGDRLFAALGENADRARAAFLGTAADPGDGLIPRLRTLVDDALAAGTASLYGDDSGGPAAAPRFPWRAVADEDEADSVLLDLRS